MTRFTIALDAMGGDFAPEEIVAGAELALRQASQPHSNLSPLEIILVGNERELQPLLQKLPSPNVLLKIHHTDSWIGMDEMPLKAVKRKAHASINLCMELLNQNQAQAVISAGNSGAVVTSAILKLGRLRGIRRPALASTIYLGGDRQLVLLDVGANVKADARHLTQFAQMGLIYATEILGITQAKIALLNNGQEDYKGTRAIQGAHQQLKKLLDASIYQGFMETDALLRGEIQVAICDGFVGNLLLKAMEGFADIVLGKFKELPAEMYSRIDYGK
jgi:glycerol-3-phosphate acyltransferase PlsX